MRRFLLSCLLLLGQSFSQFALGNDRAILRRAKIGPDPDRVAGYLCEYRQRDRDLRSLPQLIQQLGDDEFNVRETATVTIQRLGQVAVPFLQKALHNSDSERVLRARVCLDHLRNFDVSEIPEAAVRTTVANRPPNGIEGLLAYLPYAETEETRLAIAFGLDVWLRETKSVPPPLLRALSDPSLRRRAIAGCLVTRYGSSNQRQRASALLKDTNETVRLRVAQGLLGVGDTSGVPTLIELLGSNSPLNRFQAEELLRWLAGPTSPHSLIGAGSADQIERCRVAWRTWWEAHRGKIRPDFTKPARPSLMLLVGEGDADKPKGRVWLAGSDGVTRWERTEVSFPSDARMLPDGTLVLAERPTPSSSGGVTARSLAGAVVWGYYRIQRPTVCQPLDNGSLFVGNAKGDCADLHSNGEEIERYRQQEEDDLVGGSPFRRKNLIVGCRGEGYFPSQMQLLTLDTKTGKKNTVVVTFARWEQNIENLFVQILPDGRFLLSGQGRGYAYEKSLDWRHHWKCSLPGSRHAVRLADSITLLSGERGRTCEITRGNDLVWEHFFPQAVRKIWPTSQRLRLGFFRDSVCAKSVAPSLHPSTVSDTSGATQKTVVQYLHDYGERIPNALSVLDKLATFAEPSLAEEAKSALAAIERSEFVTLLHRARTEPDLKTRRALLVELEGYSADDSMVLPVFLELLHDPNPRLRDSGVRGLMGRTLFPKRVRFLLLEAFRDPDPQVRSRALRCLGGQYDLSRDLIPFFFQILLDDPSLDLRSDAKSALGNVGLEPTPFVMQELSKCSQLENKVFRKWALFHLNRLQQQ